MMNNKYTSATWVEFKPYIYNNFPALQLGSGSSSGPLQYFHSTWITRHLPPSLDIAANLKHSPIKQTNSFT